MSWCQPRNLSKVLTENLNMHCDAAKFVPRVLALKQGHVSLELCEMANDDSTFICRIIMGDESWIYSYDLGRARSHQDQRRHSKFGVQRNA